MKGATFPSVQAHSLVKRYPLFARRRERMGALLGLSRPSQYKLALDGVSFTASPGEALGIIGENGSGKSTLLRLVAGISRADSGVVKTRVPVAAILELGLGFHPEFTGRENAVLYGMLLGLSQETVVSRLGAILAFADLGPFVDQPLRTYSSGMAARLAFAVATAVDPAVLVVDEALAVGDGAFQKKCVERMVALKEGGCTILFCSHSMYLVTSFCERALWLRDGKLIALGETKDVVPRYEEYLAKKHTELALQASPVADGVSPPQRPTIAGFATDPPLAAWKPGEPLLFRVHLRVPEGCPPYHLGVSLDTMDERCVVFLATHWDDLPPLKEVGEVDVVLKTEALPLGGGQFWVNAFVFDDTAMVLWDRLRLPSPLTVPTKRWDPSLLRVNHQWELP